MTSLSFFQFIANLEQSGSWIPDALSKTNIFINSKPFILQKLKTQLQTLQHSSHNIALSKGPRTEPCGTLLNISR